MASPFGRAVGRIAERGDPDAWHIGHGPAAKSPLWRVGCWLIGLAVTVLFIGGRIDKATLDKLVHRHHAHG